MIDAKKAAEKGGKGAYDMVKLHENSAKSALDRLKDLNKDGVSELKGKKIRKWG